MMMPLSRRLGLILRIEFLKDDEDDRRKDCAGKKHNDATCMLGASGFVFLVQILKQPC